jgi:pyruvate dehydrogenase (quinone)/pyruvate oxidase
MARTAADAMVETLIDWGVDVIFGMPGDGINGIMESLRTRQDQIRFIQVRHEESAAFMACGYAKYTGKLGVCLATSGPGGIHLLNGLYDAKLDGQPVLAITGHTYHDLVGTFQQQDIDLDKVFMDVAAYSVRVMGPTHVENVTNLACRTALGYHAVTHINFPVDLQEEPVKEKEASKRNKPHHASDVFARGGGLPAEDDLRAAANILNEGKKIVILAGRGALDAGEELESLAQTLGAPIVKALLGKTCVPDDSPYTTGGLGLLGTAPSQEAIEDCDTLLMVGTSFPYMEFLPKPGQARGVQIDLDPQRIGLRYPVEIGLVGDCKRVLQKLIPMLRKHDDMSFLNKAQESMRNWREYMAELGTRTDMPMKPQVLAHELSRLLDSNAIISVDSGTNTTLAARHIDVKRGQMFSVSGTLASMACGLTYAIAAQIAYPDRQCIAFVGDGGFSMLMAEFATCAKYNLPVKVFIVKNNTLGQIKWEQMAFLGNPEYGVELHPIDYAMVAQACGGAGFTIDDPNNCGAILEKALATPGPVVVQVVVDTNEPLLPPKITREQALNFAEALAKGEPDRVKIAMSALQAKVREMI